MHLTAGSRGSGPVCWPQLPARCAWRPCPPARESRGAGLSPEAEETLSEAGLRELWEETGLDLRDSRLVVDTLGLWESVYPHLLSAGDPRRHHLVVYLHVVVPQPADQILRRLKVR